ncbi:MAG: NAD(P)-dependent alcohol dehydrogenase [Firmicutes bacterium]|nr:NAD(P)-dependent alcohol dehydrogenase [Bacillota bacterium]
MKKTNKAPNGTVTLMRASVCPKYGSAETIVTAEIPKPMPQENEILIKVSHALVTPTDCSFRTGDPFIARLFSGLLKPRIKVHGEMYAGVIEQLGSAVVGFKINDRVYGTNGMKLGSYADYICVKNTTVIRKIPQGIDSCDVITLLDGGITALPFLRDKGKIKSGQKVLIIGASGSVGSMGVQLAKHYGAHVTGVCSTSNIDIVKSLGCDEVIDYKMTDYTKQTITYDIIFDAVAKSSFSACKNILNEEGRYMTTVPTPSALLRLLFKKNQSGKKSLFAATGLRKPLQKHQDLEYLENLLKLKKIKPLMDTQYNLEDMTTAQKHVETGHKKGNVLIHI